jgi:superfamily II DNA or RNA helicase
VAVMELRPYQQDLVAKVRVRRRRCSLIVLPTGAGKTVVISEVIREAENQHVLIFVHRREIIFQIRDKLAAFGIEAGLILAGQPMNQMARVQVASVQTLSSRCLRGDMDLPNADVVAIDEAHHVRAKTYKQIIERYPDARIIGLTATPSRRDGRGLGSSFEEMVEGPQVAELIDQKFLVGTKVYAPSTPNLKGVHTRQGDYAEGQLAKRVDLPELVGDIVMHWLRLSGRKRTITFATSVGHSRHIEEELRRAGVKVAHIDGSTPKEERDDVLAQLACGDLEVVTNCMVLTEGFDLPDIGCIVLARPTKSMGLYRQMVGRGLRPAQGKDHCLVLDHSGATFQHGFVEDPVRWTLEEDRRAEAPEHLARNQSPSERGLLTCSQCSAVRTAGKPCPECGFMPKRPVEHVKVRDGDLAHLDRNGRLHLHLYSEEDKREFYQGLLYLTLSRGHKPGAAAYRFKDKFDEFPPRHWQGLEPKEPTPEVAAFDRHCRIRYAKAMQKAGASNA